MTPTPHTSHPAAAYVGRKPSGPVSTLRRLAPLRGVSHPTNRLIAATLHQSGAETLLENAA